MTGASGRLGRHLAPLLCESLTPDRRELDIENESSVRDFLMRARPTAVFHAAGFTDVQAAEQEPMRCWTCNVLGTINLVKVARELGIRLVFMSTDYVFSGLKGHYAEDDPPGPPTNYYALTKLVAEGAVMSLPDSLVIRTSFRVRPYPHAMAFTDLYTSQDYLDVLVEDYALVLKSLEKVPERILHIGTERKSSYDLAVRSRADVQPALRNQVSTPLPADVSLDCRRWLARKAELEGVARR